MNRIAGNVIVIDSAMGNVLALSSGGTIINTSKQMVNAWAVYSASSNASILLTGLNTAEDIIFRYDGGSSIVSSENPKWFSFGQAQPIENLKAPIVTSGTVLLYFV